MRLRRFFSSAERIFCERKTFDGEGNQHHVAAGQRNVGRQARAFGRNGLLGHLHHDLSAPPGGSRRSCRSSRRGGSSFMPLDDGTPRLPGCCEATSFLQRGELRPQVEVVDEGVLFVSDVDECRVQSRHDLAHLARGRCPPRRSPSGTAPCSVRRAPCPRTWRLISRSGLRLRLILCSSIVCRAPGNRARYG